MTSDDLGLAHPSAQAAEGGVRKALKALIKATQEFHEAATSHFNDSDYDFDLFLAKAEAELSVTALPDAIAALSAEGSANAAAARLSAEEMRERAAEAADQEAQRWIETEFEVPKSLAAKMAAAKVNSAMIIAASIRSLLLNPEDQQKAAATPTIADPDGEARS